MKSVNGFVVIVDDTWYKEYIPFYIYFTLRAYPDAWVFIYLRGKLSDVIQKQIELLSPKERWTIFENYKIDYPQNVFTTKALRWTIHYDANSMSEYLYIGDVDIMISIEKLSLFRQHIIHSSFIKCPYSNIIRGNQKRLSGLHFIRVCEYMRLASGVMKKYDRLLRGGCTQWGNGNELMLFGMMNEINLLPPRCKEKGNDINPKQIHFRPHHGVHLPILNPKFLCAGLPTVYSIYLSDFFNAFEENPNIFDAINKTNDIVKRRFNTAISYVRTWSRK